MTSDGGASVTAKGVCWSTAANPTTSDSHTSDGTGTSSFTSSITGLGPGTTYHVRAYATNSVGTGYGSDVSFTTSSASTLYVSTNGLCGGKNPCYDSIQEAIDAAKDGDTILVAQGDYPETALMDLPKQIILLCGYDDAFEAKSFVSKIVALRISKGMITVEALILGGQRVITKPTATTNPASSVTSNSATLNGTVNPNGASTTYYFQYGPTVSYGTNTTSTSAGSGSSGVSANASISGLACSTTYHYGLVATNSVGTTYGSDQTFTTESGTGTYTNSLGQTFVLIPAGTFTMGSPSSELGRDSDEGPQHEVTLTQAFYMQTTEVTQAQWEAVMGSNPSRFSGCSTCPVEKVFWNDVQSYITQMNLRGEGTYSLSTEAQWEYAARAGSTTAFYNGGITETGCGYDSNLNAIGWYCYNADSKTHPVAGKVSNAWGLYDMSGNVWEWCQDWYSSSYYTSSAVTDPTGPSSGSYRVIRGGYWYYYAGYCRSASRDYENPDWRGSSIGFRLLRQP